MLKIAHRGNWLGRNIDRENTSSYINEALANGFHVEVDVWFLSIYNTWHLGHDFPKEKINISFLENPSVWSHAKNLEAYFELYNNPKAHVFWHDKDDFTFTSKGIKWCKAGYISHDGIMVMPELKKSHTKLINTRKHVPLGICSDDFRKFTI